MKLLITTQAVDRNDPTLGFFHRWIEEFAKQAEHVTVICLREGEYALPNNVVVYEIGRGSRIIRTWRFVRYIVQMREQYERVFVHMNPEYIVVGGWLWKLLGKKIALWYTHKSVDGKLRVAALFADIIFTASKESFRLKTKNVHIMGHGIDTDFFSPDPRVARGTHVLSVGRLMKSKRHDLAIRAATSAGRELYIAGEGPEREDLERQAQELGVRVRFLGALSQAQLRDEYRRAAYLIHRSETGSLDKVVLEALACGLPVETSNPALKALEHKRPEYVREHHSLGRLISAILQRLA